MWSLLILLLSLFLAWQVWKSFRYKGTATAAAYAIFTLAGSMILIPMLFDQVSKLTTVAAANANQAVEAQTAAY